MASIHILLAVQSLVIIAGSVNRLTSIALNYVAPNEFLRWVDFNNMLIIPLVSVVASYFLKRHIENSGASSAPRWQRVLLTGVFIAGIYWLGASYGTHEVTNYLHTRFCAADESLPGNACAIIIYNDDEFSHVVFFIAFVMINAVLLLTQVLHPYTGTQTRRDRALLTVNALFIAAGIFANLAFETIGLDLWVVAVLAALSLYFLWRRGAQPLVYYYSAAYVVGLVATGIAIAVRG
jgi:hypothetical protein